ncbi:MAG: Hint domain-containing protein [Paracoccaceae bacterium]
MFMSDITRTAATPALAAASVSTGITAGTLVETANGWRAVESLRCGDAIHSFDGGLVRILGLDRNWLLPSDQTTLLHIPGGAFDNCTDLMLAEHQHLLIDTLGDLALPDTLHALIPAAALAGFRGTKRVSLSQPIELLTPLFAQVEAIYANSGTLLHCPAMIHGPARLPQGDDFTCLDLAQSRALLRRIENRDGPVPAALRMA